MLGLLATQSLGSFNDNAWKQVVILLTAAAATGEAQAQGNAAFVQVVLMVPADPPSTKTRTPKSVCGGVRRSCRVPVPVVLPSDDSTERTALITRLATRSENLTIRREDNQNAFQVKPRVEKLTSG